MKNSEASIYSANTERIDISVLDSVQNDLCSARLSPEELKAAMEAFPIRTVKKGTYLLKQGQIASKCYYIFKGCVREYCLKNGEEWTTAFYVEGDSLSSAVSRIHGTPVKQFWECMEDKYVYTINRHFQLGLFEPHFTVFWGDSAAIAPKNGSFDPKIPSLNYAD